MSDLWTGDVGIRVTDLERSIEFYNNVFDLEEIDRGGDDEGKLDHFEVRVRSVPETHERLKRVGILPATRTLWVNRQTVAKLKDDPKFEKLMQEDMWTSRNGHRIAYIQDPDGIFFCLYDHPEEPWEGPSGSLLTEDNSSVERSPRGPATEARRTGSDYFGSSMGRATVGDSLRTFGVNEARARSASPTREI